MAKRLSGSARRELVAAVRARYGANAPSVKREILREFSAITGYHRKSAIRILLTTMVVRAGWWCAALGLASMMRPSVAR
jgi:hypothetical protein